jgi:hypothetical protein
VRAGLLLRVAAAFRAVTVTPVPACHGIALLANVPDRQRRDGRPERVIQVLKTLKIAGHVAGKERDPDTRVDGNPAVLPGEYVGGGRRFEQVREPEPADHAAADSLGERGQIGRGDRPRWDERRRSVTRRCGSRRAVSRPVCAEGKNPALSVDRKLTGTSAIGPHPARPAPAIAFHDPPRSAVACRSPIGRPIHMSWFSFSVNWNSTTLLALGDRV